MSAVQVLEKSESEYGERIAAVECHDATVRHVGNRVTWNASNRRYQRRRAYELLQVRRENVRRCTPADVVVDTRLGAEDEGAAIP